jgi:hypothetical protein
MSCGRFHVLGSEATTLGDPPRWETCNGLWSGRWAHSAAYDETIGRRIMAVTGLNVHGVDKVMRLAFGRISPHLPVAPGISMS